MRMPWGKHMGQEIAELPDSYLKWLAENCDNEKICIAADKEYQYRADNGLLAEKIWEVIDGIRYGRKGLE